MSGDRPLLNPRWKFFGPLRGLSRIQATHDETAAYFSVAPYTFQAFLKRSPEAGLEIERGRSERKIALRPTAVPYGRTKIGSAIAGAASMSSAGLSHHQAPPTDRSQSPRLRMKRERTGIGRASFRKHLPRRRALNCDAAHDIERATRQGRTDRRHRDVLQSDSQASEERDAVTRSTSTAAANVTCGAVHGRPSYGV